MYIKALELVQTVKARKNPLELPWYSSNGKTNESTFLCNASFRGRSWSQAASLKSVPSNKIVEMTEEMCFSNKESFPLIYVWEIRLKPLGKKRNRFYFLGKRMESEGRKAGGIQWRRRHVERGGHGRGDRGSRSWTHWRRRSSLISGISLYLW